MSILSASYETQRSQNSFGLNETEEMSMNIRFQNLTRVLCFCFILTSLLASSGYSQEEIAKYPSRPITFIDPMLPGNSGDLAIRLLGKEAEKYLGQPIVVVNKPGGGGTVGVAAIATAKPDGYTIGQSSVAASLFVIPYFEKVPYHPIKDLRQIMQYSAPNFGVIAKGDSPFRSFMELIAYARQNPKKVTYGTNGLNSLSNLIMEQIARKERVQFTHIPFKSSPDFQAALLGGHILFTAGDFSHSLIEGGETKLLLLLSEQHRIEYPQTPIPRDIGYEIPFPGMISVTAPEGIPDEIAKKLEEAFTRGMKEQAFLKGMKDLRLPIVYRNSKELSDYVVYNYEFFGKLLKDTGLIK